MIFNYHDDRRNILLMQIILPFPTAAAQCGYFFFINVKRMIKIILKKNNISQSEL